MKITNLLLLTTTFLFIGCGGNKGTSGDTNTDGTTKIQKVKIDKTASADNFKKVLNDYYNRHCIGIDLDAQFPLYEKINSTGSVEQKYLDLKKLGLIKLSDAKFDINKEYRKRGIMNWSDDADKVKMVNGKKIELTEKGKKIYKAFSKNEQRSYMKAKFCLANYEVIAVTNYTKPKDFMGMTLSRVNYTVKPTNVISFIDDITKIKSFNYFKDRTTQEIDKRADLVLTEMKGWMHSKEFKR